ncbi:MAG: IS1 family transposase [Paludibacteraceae bacterium]
MAHKENFGSLCSRLGVEFCCPHCKSVNIIKSGKNCKGKQRYSCKHCSKRFITDYSYKAYKPDINAQIIQFTKEGLGIRSTARVLAISVTTLLKRIIRIASEIEQPVITQNREYEVDEMRIFVGSKSRRCWIVYALDRSNKRVVSFNAGRRTNRTLNVVLKICCLQKLKPFTPIN